MRCFIQLTKGKRVELDPADYRRVSALGVRWCVNDGYAFNRAHGRMHRLLMGVTDPAVMVDHRDGDPLNNLRSNLRIATNSLNQANRQVVRGLSRFKGVCRQKRKHSKDVWIARIIVGGKNFHLGSFDEELQAAKAYDAAALKHFGDFARTNFQLDLVS